MLAIISDTHATDGHRLRGQTLDAVRTADLVVHAGDFVTEAALDAVRAESASLAAVAGNRDEDAVRDRLPAERTVTHGGVCLAVTHTRRGGATALALFGRERDADAVVHGHTHRPAVDAGADPPLVNPGSHARPRGARAAHAELEPADGGLDGRLVTPEGAVVETFTLQAGDRPD